MNKLKRWPRVTFALAVLPLAFLLVSVLWLLLDDVLIPASAPTVEAQARAVQVQAAADWIRLGVGLLALLAWVLFLLAASLESSLDRKQRTLWCLGILAFPWGAMPAFARRYFQESHLQ